MNNLFKIYKDTISLSLKVFLKNYLLIPATLLLMFSFGLLGILLAPTGIVGGIILNLASICMLSMFYGWISIIVRDKKITVKELTVFQPDLFFAIINSGFFIWLALFIYASMSKGIENQAITLCISLFVGVVFNPLSEIIIYDRLQGIEALKRSYQFVTTRWIEWFIPFAIFLIAAIGLQYEKALQALIGFDPIFSFISLLRPWVTGRVDLDSSFIVVIIIAIISTIWFSIFRVLLYAELIKR